MNGLILIPMWHVPLFIFTFWVLGNRSTHRLAKIMVLLYAVFSVFPLDGFEYRAFVVACPLVFAPRYIVSLVFPRWGWIFVSSRYYRKFAFRWQSRIYPPMDAWVLRVPYSI